MEAERRKKRCRHALVEGTCSLCAGIPRSDSDLVDILGDRSGCGPVVLGFHHNPWSHLRWDGNEDVELVQESACSLL